MTLGFLPQAPPLLCSFPSLGQGAAGRRSFCPTHLWGRSREPVSELSCSVWTCSDGPQCSVGSAEMWLCRRQMTLAYPCRGSCCSERKVEPLAPARRASGCARAKDPHAPGDWHSLFDRLVPVLHQQADGCGCCVELGHLVLVHHAPHAPHLRVGGDTFKLSRRQGSHTAVPRCRCSAAPPRREELRTTGSSRWILACPYWNARGTAH